MSCLCVLSYQVSSGHPARMFIDAAVRHVLLRQGVLGIKVRNGMELHFMWQVRWMVL